MPTPNNKKAVKLEYNPTPNEENDAVVITVTNAMKEDLKKVCVLTSDTIADQKWSQPFQRYKVKSFIMGRYDGLFSYFFSKDMITNGAITLKCGYRKFLELNRELHSAYFAEMMNDIANYGQRVTEIEVRNENGNQ